MRIDNKICLSITSPPLPIVEDHEDEMMIVVRCPNCVGLTKVGTTRMISGYIGCDNDYKGGSCYFDDLLPRVLEAKRSRHKDPEFFRKYVEGDMYSQKKTDTP